LGIGNKNARLEQQKKNGGEDFFLHMTSYSFKNTTHLAMKIFESLLYLRKPFRKYKAGVIFTNSPPASTE
jgi:hypothetical protein